ncbi:hypothetical protein RYA60_18535 [Pseudomonas syringae]|nr:hypothetical protein [Pseudomonas syringae]
MNESSDQSLKLQVGRTYRAKTPRVAGNREVNDRTVTWIGSCEVQYDGPSVGFGKHYPKVEKEKFLAWADRDVTDELPPNQYAKWPPSKKPAA